MVDITARLIASSLGGGGETNGMKHTANCEVENYNDSNENGLAAVWIHDLKGWLLCGSMKG